MIGAATTPREAALELHALGLSVIPLHAPGMRLPREPDEIGKVPLLASWKPYQTRRATPEELRRWWTSWPSANVGLVTGAVSGVIVFDVDSAEGWDAFTALGVSALEDGRGPWVAKTARGYHVYYAHPGDGQVIRNRTGLMPGVDVRGDGGYVVAPPSIHASGVAYTWLTPPGFLPLAPVPRVLRVLLASSANGNGGDAPAPALGGDGDAIPEGQRNATLFREARSRLARGASPETMRTQLLDANAARCVPPLRVAEVEQIAAHASTDAHRPDFAEPMTEAEAQGYAAARQAKRRTSTEPNEPAPAVAVVTSGAPAEPETAPSVVGEPGAFAPRTWAVRLSDVAPKAVEWLWPGYIPRGKLTLLIGDPGTGKSTILLDLIARVTQGAAWPDGCAAGAPPSNAVILTAEDGLADTVRPRLDRLGGDPARVWAIQAVSEGSREHSFTLDRDLAALERLIVERHAVVVDFDPLSAYLGKLDSFKDDQVRGVLGPVAHMAERTGVTILGLLHMTKDSERRAIYRALGSIAFSAAPRAVFAVGADPNDADLRYLTPVKMNLGPKPPTLAFRIIDRGAGAVVEWEPTPVAGMDADRALSGYKSQEDREEHQEAQAFLREVLGAEGVMKATEAYKAARQAGISERSLRRAKAQLGVVVQRDGFGSGSAWLWSLPEPAPEPEAARRRPSASPGAVSTSTPGDVASFDGLSKENNETAHTSPKAATSPNLASFGGRLRESGRLHEPMTRDEAARYAASRRRPTPPKAANDSAKAATKAATVGDVAFFGEVRE